MMVRFLRGYRGALTHEQFHMAGAEIDLPNGEAARLIADGVCEPVAVQESKPEPKQARRKGK